MGDTRMKKIREMTHEEYLAYQRDWYHKNKKQPRYLQSECYKIFGKRQKELNEDELRMLFTYRKAKFRLKHKKEEV